MIEMLPEAVRKGLEQARRSSVKRNDRLCVHDGADVYRILRLWDKGLSIDAKHGDRLRGRVEVYDGERHLYQCLIENGRQDEDEIVFDFKWLHPVAQQPAADFVRPDGATAGLITHRKG